MEGLRMKRGLFIFLFVMVLSILPAVAQNISKESEYYYINTTIEKIFPYRKGYVVQYRKGLTTSARLYLPVEWFTEAAGRGEIVRIGPGREWPSLSIYYKNGEFSHVRLYVRPYSHESWGSIPLNINLDSYFADVNDVRLEY
jgi:hypothetical protein